MARPLLIFEDIPTVRRIPIGSVWGVKVTITPRTWLGPVIFFVWGFALALLNRETALPQKLVEALFFMLSVEAATALHAFGHILSGKMAGSAMDELLVTAMRDVNLYVGDQSRYPPAVHLARSLGGPLFNLGVAGLLFALLPALAPGLLADLVRQTAGMNLFFGVGSFLPIPSVDGEVIWRELFRLLRGETAAEGSS